MKRLILLSLLGLSLLGVSTAHAQFISCTDRPDLCDRPVTSEIQTTNLAQAQDVVFLGDGYTAADQNKFADDVTRLVNELKTLSGGHALVGLDPTLFNYHRVDVTSVTANLANDDLFDTAFGAKAIAGQFIYYSDSALLFAAAQNVPDVDTVVLLVNTDAGQANASHPALHISGGHMVMPAGGGAHLLSHELGHAIFRLEDEYTTQTGCYQGSERQLVRAPNLAIDPEGRKFDRAYANPATQNNPVEGGLSSQCMYRPAIACKMRATHAAWCPVCAHQMRLRLEEKRHNDDREMPFSGLLGIAGDRRAAGVLDLYVGAADARGVDEAGLWIDGTLRTTDPYRPYVWDTSTEPVGLHTVTTRATDTSGKTNDDGIQYQVTVFRDTQAPAITIQSPVAGSTLVDAVVFDATVTDDFRLAGWDLYIDGVHVSHFVWADQAIAQDIISLDLNTTAHADGAHVITLAVWDTSDNRATASVEVIFQNSGSGIVPDVAIHTPQAESTVAGIVPVQITASDDDGIARVELLVDGMSVGTRSKPPYNIMWDSALWPNGNHTLVARAYDTDDNVGFSTPVPVWISNTTGWSVLFVASAKTLTVAEQTMVNRLASVHGAAVTTVAARSAKAAHAKGKQLVIVSPSVAPAAVNKKFRRVNVGVLLLSAQLFNDNGLTGRRWETHAGIRQDQYRLNIVTPDHPLAAGLQGRSVRVTPTPSAFGWGVPSQHAVIAAALLGEPPRAASFGYESGVTMVGGLVAPARRTGLFTTESAINAMKAQSKGWELWDAAVRWTAGR